MRFILVLLTSLGVGLFCGGLLAFLVGSKVMPWGDGLSVSGLGTFNGRWVAADYCFLGAVLAGLGSALATAGWVGLGPRGRK